MTSGSKTTEFWVALIVMIVGVVVIVVGAVGGDKGVTISGIAATVLTQLGYTKARTKVKAAENEQAVATKVTASEARINATATMVNAKVDEIAGTVTAVADLVADAKAIFTGRSTVPPPSG